MFVRYTTISLSREISVTWRYYWCNVEQVCVETQILIFVSVVL